MFITTGETWNANFIELFKLREAEMIKFLSCCFTERSLRGIYRSELLVQCGSGRKAFLVEERSVKVERPSTESLVLYLINRIDGASMHWETYDEMHGLGITSHGHRLLALKDY